METASVSHDEEHQHAVISFADGAKVRNNLETTKDKEQKKELPPVLPLGTNRRGISKAAQKFGEQRDFKAPQALSGDTELTARAANVLNSVAKVQHNFDTTKYPRHIS